MFDISEEENAANTYTQWKQEVVVNTESIQGERNIICEDETTDYHEKTDESPSINDDPTVYYEGDKEGLVYYSYVCMIMELASILQSLLKIHYFPNEISTEKSKNVYWLFPVF